MGMRSKKTLIESANELAEGIRPALESAVDSAMEAVESAREKAGPLLQDARDKAAPYITDAKDKAAPILAEGKALAAEKAVAGKALATEKAHAGRQATLAKVNELRGIEPEPKKGGKLKKLLLLGLLAGLGGVLFKKLRGGQRAGDNWQSNYVPTPPPAPQNAAQAPTPSTSEPAAAPAERAQDDQAAATPDEALSDAADTPHPDTTPENPAEVVDLKAFADTAATAPASEAPAATDPAAADAPYGPGSAAPLEGGAAPDASYTVKGNADSMLFHPMESPYFDRTIAEVWFTDAETATAAGFKAWDHRKHDASGS